MSNFSTVLSLVIYCTFILGSNKSGERNPQLPLSAVIIFMLETEWKLQLQEIVNNYSTEIFIVGSA